MNNKKLITEELGRIQEIMYGKNLLKESFLGSLTRQAVANSIRASIESVMDDFVKEAIRLGTKQSAMTAKQVIDDVIKDGTKAAMKVAKTSLKVYDDVAKKAFGQSYNTLDDNLKLTIKNQVRTAMGDTNDDVIKSAMRASDDLASKAKKVLGGVDDAGKQVDNVVDDAGKNIRPKSELTGWRKWAKKAGDKWKSMTRKQRLLFLAGAGVGLYLLWKYFSENTPEFSDCIKNGVNDADLDKITADGGENVFRTSTGVSELDAMGGIKFLPNGTAETIDGTKTGTWSDNGSSIEIVIDGNTYTMKCVSTPVIPPTPEDTDKVTYRNCTSLPFTKGCKNSKIRDIQNCIGAKVDGAYGPETESKLIEKGYPTEITQEVYDKIIKNCGQSATDEIKPELTPDVTSTYDI
jgi:hypothetical protein